MALATSSCCWEHTSAQRRSWNRRGRTTCLNNVESPKCGMDFQHHPRAGDAKELQGRTPAQKGWWIYCSFAIISFTHTHTTHSRTILFPVNAEDIYCGWWILSFSLGPEISYYLISQIMHYLMESHLIVCVLPKLDKCFCLIGRMDKGPRVTCACHRKDEG